MLLERAGVAFRSVSPAVDEKRLISSNPQWAPAEASRRLASAKAVDVSRRFPRAIVIGADQVLALEGTIFGKPADRTECRKQLERLRGRQHQLISTVVCAVDGHPIWSCREAAAMAMRDFSEQFLEDYLDRAGPAAFSSVGGYQLEGLGIQLFDSVDGDYFAILGLPLVPLLNHLRFLGVLPS